MTPEITDRPPKRKRREALLRLARQAAAETDPEQVLRALLTEAQRALDGTTSGAICRWDEERQLLVEFLNTLPGGIGPKTVALGQGAAGRAAAQRVPVIIDDYQHLADALTEVQRAGVQAAVAAPLLHEGRLLGVVVIASNRCNVRFSSDDADVLVMLGGIAASALVDLERKRTEERLRLATDRLEQLTETTSDAIIVTDCAMRVRAWNRGAETMYGWDRQEVLGQSPPCVPPDRREATQALWRRVLERGETVANVEEVRVTWDGRRVPIVVTLSPLRDEGGAIIGMIGIGKDVSALKVVEQQRCALARLQERESIAMDLHDNTIQALHGAVLSLAAAERTTADDAEAMPAIVRQVREQLNGTIQDLRNYLELRTCQTSRRGLTAGLMGLAREVRLNPDITMDLAIDESVALLALDDRLVEQLLAIAREATSNAVRHAQAYSLTIRLSQEGSQLVLVVIDNGSGFDPPAIDDRSSGRGLTNLSERARLIGGRLEVTSRPGAGTQVRLELPLGREPLVG